jgi:hypothetical protein
MTEKEGYCKRHNMHWTGGCPWCHLERFWGEDMHKVMGYAHCEKHDRDATNGCIECKLENAHFHKCSDERFCRGFGSTYCEDEYCTQDHGNTLVGSKMVWLFEPKPCAKCQLGRELEREKRERDKNSTG